MQRFSRIAAVAIVASLLASCAGGQHATMPSTSPLTQQQQLHANPVLTYTVNRHVKNGPGPIDVVFHYNGQGRLVPSTLPLWNGSFVYQNNTYNYTMVGTDPSSNNFNTVVPAAVIPIIVNIGSTTYDPTQPMPNGVTTVASTMASPILHAGVTFKSGNVLMGDGQYLAAFQRGNFWLYTKAHKMERVRLQPTVYPAQTINPGSNGGQGNPLGIEVGMVNINYIDPVLNNLITTLNIPPGTIPIFMVYDVYLTEGSPVVQNCCIGGYHNYNGTNTYMEFSYIYNPNNNVTFSQDVGALSHETGEWIDDPLISNGVPCGILEVGDPLEGGPNYGLYPYTLNGTTYHLQDLVYLPYFGAPPDTSVKGQFSFQGAHLSVCQNGG